MHTTKENKLWLLIEESLIANAQKPCISYKGVELSYSEVHKRVNLTTSFLFNKQVASIYNNCSNPIYFITLQLASIQLGIPSYFFQPKDRNVIVFDDNTIESVFESFKTSVAIFSISNKEAYSFFFNSSGTTKSPHVVENSSLLFYNICKAIKTYKPMNDYLGRYENFLLCCPLNHSFGFSSLIEMLIYGVHICFPESFFILDIIKEISRCEDNKINSILASPFIVEKSIQLLHGSFLPKIQHIGLGTDKPNKKLIEIIYTYNPQILLSNRYGLTELPSAIFVSNFKSKEVAMKNIFDIVLPLPIYKYEVLPIDKDEYELSILNLLTNERIPTGDCVGYDKQNKIYLIGRNKDVIKYNGIRIDCVAVENILNECKEIDDCLLYMRENRLILEYVSKKQTVLNLPIKSFWRENVSSEYYPDIYINVNNIHRTITGKKQRRKE